MLRFGLSCVGLCSCFVLGCLDPDTPEQELAALSPEACAGSVVEVDRLLADGQLDRALREATNGSLACGTLPDLSERRAEILRQLGTNTDVQPTWADARASWLSAAAHSSADPAQAQRDSDRALYLAERATGMRARRTTLAQRKWASWSDKAIWLYVSDRLASIVRIDLSGEQPVPVAIRDTDAWMPKLLWSPKHRSMIVPGAQSVGVYGDEPAGWTLAAGHPHLTPDEDTLVVSGRDSVTLYDLASRKLLNSVRTTPDATAQLAPEGRLLGNGDYFADFGSEGVTHTAGRAVLVDLKRGELLFDQRVRASAASRSGRHLAAVVVDWDNSKPADHLLLWDLEASSRSSVSVALEGRVAEVPSLQFDRQELQVRVSYAPATAQPAKAAAGSRAAVSYALSSGARVESDPARFERRAPARTSALRELSGRGYEPLEAQATQGGMLFEPVTASTDGSTLVFVEAVNLGSRNWTDPRAVFVDLPSGGVRARIELKHGLIRSLRLKSSANGRWLFACMDSNDSGLFVDATTGATHGIQGVQCDSVELSPDSPFAMTADGLLRLSPFERIELDWEVCRIGPILAPSSVCRE